MDKVVISKINNEDIHKAAILIKGVHDTMLKERTEFLNTDEDFEKYLKENIDSKDYVFLKATYDDMLVGVCTCNIKHVGDGIETRIRDILFIEYIAVDENIEEII